MDRDDQRRVVRFRRRSRPKAAWRIAVSDTFGFMRENAKLFLLMLFLLAILTGQIPLDKLVEKLTDPVALVTLLL
jgi:hypothetical protein